MNRRRSPAAQLASLCRTCMSSRWNDRIMHNIYDKCGLNDKDPTIIELLQEVHKHSAATMLTSDFHNKLPQVICSGCVENLQISYDFLRMCSESEKKFEKMLKDLDNRDDNAILEECINGPEDGVTFTVFSVKKEPAEDDAERFDYEYEAEPSFAYDRLASSHYEEDVHGDEEDLLSDNHFINMDDYECDDYDNYIDGDGDDDDNDYIDFSNSQEMSPITHPQIVLNEYNQPLTYPSSSSASSVIDMLKTTRPELWRELGPPCKSTFCLKCSARHCQRFDTASRRNIYEKFWSLSRPAMKSFVCQHAIQVSKKRHRIENSKKKVSFEYKLPYGKNKVLLQVCRTMFISTLAISESMVRRWVVSQRKRPG